MNDVRGVLKYFMLIHRRPRTRKIAWILTAAWATALFLPALSIAVSPNWRGLDLTIWVGWSNLICATLDSIMLYHSIRGLMWSYNFPREKSDTLAG